MIVDSLIRQLRGWGIAFSYEGPGQAEIYAVQMGGGRMGDLREGVLYILGPDRPHDGDVCALRAEEAQLDFLSTAAQSILIRDARRKNLLLRLHHAAARGRSLTAISRLCSDIMQNPVLILREDLTVLAWHGFQEDQDFHWIKRLNPNFLMEKFRDNPVVHIKSEMGIPCRCMLGRIRRGAGSGFICVLDREGAFGDAEEQNFMRQICAVLSNTARPAANEVVGDLDALIVELMQGRPRHPEAVKKRLAELHYKAYEKYYVVAVEGGSQNPAYSAEDLKKSLGTDKIYEYGAYRVAVLHSRWNQDLAPKDFSNFTDFLKTAGLQAGLSYGFFDITDISYALRQAIKCIELNRQNNWDIVFNDYSNLVISHMMETCVRYGETRLEDLCHPITLKIREYDEKHHTNLLNVLTAYVFSGLSARRTARAMHLHPNSVYQRVHKLREMFGIDFSNRRLLIKLHVSVIALTYMGVVDGQDYSLGYP